MITMIFRITYRASLCAWAACFTALFFQLPAARATIWWSGNGNAASWGQASNWSVSSSNSGPVPNPLTINANDLIFNVDGKNGMSNNYTTNLNDERRPASLQFRGSGILQIGPGTSGAGANNLLSIGSGGLQNSSGGILSISSLLETRGAHTWNNSGSLNIQNNLTISGASLTITGAGTTTISGNITSSTAALNKNGMGLLVISGNSNYTGITTINGGTLRLGSNNRINDSSPIVINSGAAFSLDGYSETIASLEGSGQAALGAGSLTVGANNASTTFNGTITGSGGSLGKIGSGRLILTGGNSYSGGTTIGGGYLRVIQGALPTSGTVTVNNGAVLEFEPNSTYGSSTQLLQLNGSTLTNDNVNVGESTWNGNLALTGNNVLTHVSVQGNITGTGGLQTFYTTRMFGNNNYAGGTTNEGLLVGNSNGLQGAINNHGNLVFEQSFNGTFHGNAFGAGTFYKDGAGILTIETAVSNAMVVRSESIQGTTASLQNTIDTYANTLVRFDQNFGGNFDYAITGIGGVNISGGGTVVYTANNTYTGITTINQATLQIGNGGATGSISNSSIITNNGSLIINRSNDYSYSGTLNGTGSLTKSGAGIFALSGTTAYTGATTINAGTLLVGSSSAAVPSASAVTINGGTFDLNSFNDTIGSLAGSGNVTLGSGTLTLGGNNASTSYYGNISGSGSLTKNGGGIFTVAGNNSYGGSTTINGGTLRLGSNTAIPATSNLILNGSILDVNGQNQTIASLSGTGGITLGGGTLVSGGNNSSTTFAGSISGVGSFSKAGTGTLTLTGNNTYDQTLINSGGTIRVGNGGTTGTLGTGSTSVANLATLEFNRSNDLTYSGSISGFGALVKNGTGNLTLRGSNSYGGGTTVNQGTLTGDTGSLPGSISVASGAAVAFDLDFDQNVDGTYSGAISGAGQLVKNGVETLTLSGANTYAGGTTINSGKLVVNGSLSTGLVTVQTGAILGGRGTIGGSVIGPGTVAPGNSPGILTINGDYTQSPNSNLAIEVGGSETRGAVAGTDYDQVRVGGTATLGGTYNFTLINKAGTNTPFVPALNDEITFLTAPNHNIVGAPKDEFVPNLEHVLQTAGQDPKSLGFVVIKNDHDLKLRFVTPTDIHFIDNTNQAGIDKENWNEAMNWQVGVGDHHVPTPADIVNLSRSQTGAVQRVDVKSLDTFGHPLNATTFTLDVGDPTSPITVGVKNLNTLSASLGDITIGKNAAVELGTAGNMADKGELSTLTDKTVEIQNGGALKGNGTVTTGSLNLMNGSISPGFSIGHLKINGDYLQGSQGQLNIEATGIMPTQVDSVAVTGEATLGGSLVIDASSFSGLTAGTTIAILTANDGIVPNTFFANTRTVGAPGFFTPVYTANGVDGRYCPPGDMNPGVEGIDYSDIGAFALGLRNPQAYRNKYHMDPSEGGDVDFNGHLDFSDIDEFALILEQNHITNANAAIQAALANVPEPATIVFGILGILAIVSSRSRRRASA